MENLDEQAQKRVNALKNIQLKVFDIESNFYEEVYKLEKKFAIKYAPLYDDRAAIVSGTREPTDEEATWTYATPEAPEKLDSIDADNKKTKDGKGLESFWLNTLKSTNCILEKIQEHDEPILEKISDIRVKIRDSLPLGYTVEFHFAENEWFTNKVLTKSFELTTDRDKEYPFRYENGALYKAIGCEIAWKEGKNVTVKQTKKKMAAADENNNQRSVSEEQRVHSFFEFFKSHTTDGVRPVFKKLANSKTAEKTADKPKTNEEDGGISEEAADNLIEYLFELDFELAQQIKENIIPKAVLYFTGELNDGVLEAGSDFGDLGSEDDEDDEDDDSDDDNDDDEDDDDEEEDTDATNGGPKKKSKV